MIVKPMLLVPAIITIFLFSCTGLSPETGKTETGEGIKIKIYKQPILVERSDNENISITVPALLKGEGQVSVRRIDIKFNESGSVKNLSSLKIYYNAEGSDPSEPKLFGSTDHPGSFNRIRGNLPIKDQDVKLSISFVSVEKPDLIASLVVSSIRIFFSGRKPVNITVSEEKGTLRFGRILRKAGQDNCDTYRIPGLVTTKTGTLVAVYDNRYNRSKDLQEDIDIGMSRSIDGGDTWEPMKVIMDMGKYGGKPEQLNGIGDPSILYDDKTNTIWVAALWISGASPDDMLWFASKPGMKPEETGQLMMVSSTDDGLTWSDPVNITSQIKNPSWQLLLQGPGRGITMTDGTLVFPAQFKSDLGKYAIDGGRYTCHSTIIYSKDNGKTWKIGTGAKPNTTEAQVVELNDGSLMLNMRDDLNRKDKSYSNGRAVSVTSDFGTTWKKHPSSNSLLPEPNCMASLISADVFISGEKKKVLFFSNPDSRSSRTNMTIKASLDEGMSWPEKYKLELYEPEGFGYSCLTMVDEKTIGILYEATKELFFQKIPVSEIIKDME